ncbi:MAG: mannitol dehydrogenase family protein [Bacteroidales bacterium]|nr:mannitol dehydrogenase family protein [Bacteroidales bacterium]
MHEIIKLNSKNLYLLPKEVVVPAYNRAEIKTGIVHVGIGNFHRAHQAFYTDQLLQKFNINDWGICGVALLETDLKIVEALRCQDGLYTLMVNESDGSLTARVIGSVTEFLFAPENPEAVLEKMANPAIKIITLTITEGGYNFDTATGEFQITESAIQWDLCYPDNPKTIFGYLTQALKRRRDRGLAGLTLQSCDNIQHNGDILKEMLLAFIQVAEPGLTDWIEKKVSFPNSMVDRITPAIKASDIENLKTTFGIEDTSPVVCEPFFQWVIEDRYATARPPWEKVGAHFVSDVAPYEKMKIRLLNGGHSLLGIIGSLKQYNTIDETVNDPLLRIFLREFMDIEVSPILGEITGVNLEEYKNSVIQRFGNKNIKDQLSRICSQSSAKLPKFLIPTIKEQLEIGGPIKKGTLILAAWCRYMELAGTSGYDYEVMDEMQAVLKEGAKASAGGDPLAFLKIKTVFGDLVNSKHFVDTYLVLIDSIREYGVTHTIGQLN